MSSLAPFESSIAERYHEETKYSEEGLRREGARQVAPEWDRQPAPFKSYPGPRVLLPSEGLPLQRRGRDAVAVPEPAPPGRLDLARLARILWHTNGCTRILTQAGGVMHFRAAPSAGARYPTEVYVAIHDVPGIEPGVYDYQLLDHALVPVAEDGSPGGDPLQALSSACFGHPAVAQAQATVILTGIWYRSSWRYRERGYRRALLDTGHVLGNLVVGAPVEGVAAVPLGDFRDDLVEDLLGVDPVEEGVLVVAPIVAAEVARTLPDLPTRRSATREWHRALDAVGDRVPEDRPERLIAAIHLAGRLEAGAEPVTAPAPAPPAAPESALVIGAGGETTTWTADDPVTATIAVRRSTRRFRPEPVPKDALLRALGYSLPADLSELCVPELLRTYLVSVDVVGLPPGSYVYETSPRRLVELARGQYAGAMHHLGLGQDIFLNAGAVVVHTADLTRAVERYGDRVYRSLKLDAGHIGERLNLALLHEGIGVSGVGGYYDDEMNRVLRIPESQAVIYMTTLGVPA